MLTIASAAVVGTSQVAVTLAGASGDLVLTDAVKASTIKVSGIARKITAAAASGAVVTFTLDYECYKNQPVTFSFNPLLGSIADGAGNSLDTTTDQAVTGGTDTSFQIFAQDADGWTDTTKLLCEKTIYVSAAGNDGNDGLTELTPKLTVAGAIAATTNGTAYWIKLRRGDTFAEAGLGALNGKAGGWAVWTYYGDPALPPPVLGTGAANAIFTTGQYHIYLGLKLDGKMTPSLGWSYYYMEDCELTGRFSATATQSYHRYTFRRSRLLNGVGIQNGMGLLVEECYSQYDLAGACMRDNVLANCSLRPYGASLLGLAVRNISTYSAAVIAPYVAWGRFDGNARFIGNVVTGWPGNQLYSYGGSGEQTVKDNLLVNWEPAQPDATARAAIKCANLLTSPKNSGEITGNIFYRAPGVQVGDDAKTTQIVERNTFMNMFGMRCVWIRSGGANVGRLNNNRYWADEPESIFAGYEALTTGIARGTIVDGKCAAWTALAPNDNSTFVRVNFKDPRRTVATYAGANGKTATVDGFIAAAKAATVKATFDATFFAPAIREYFLDGFTEVPAGQEPYIAPLAGKTLLSDAPWQLPIDDEGWVDPVDDPLYTRKVYVSSTGNDANDGLSEATPVATIAKGMSLCRAYHPDRLCLKCGDTWTLAGLPALQLAAMGSDLFVGRSPEWPIVIQAYGNAALGRPVIKITGTSIGLTLRTANFILRGVKLYSTGRDPASADYLAANINTLNFGITDGTQAGRYIWIEDNHISYFGVGAELSNGIKNVVFRRNHLYHNWGDSSLKSQGMHSDGADGLLIEENTLYENGWLPGNGAGTESIFNHNCYNGNTGTPVIFRRNLSARASSHGCQMRRGGECHDNYFEENGIHLSFGYVNGSPVYPGGVSMDIHDCAFIGSKGIGAAPRDWAIEIQNTNPAEQHFIRSNLFANQRVGGDHHALQFITGTVDNPTSAVGTNNVTVKDNIVYNWMGLAYIANTLQPNTAGQYNLTNLAFSGNKCLGIVNNGTFVEHALANTSETAFAGNAYYDSVKLPAQWFKVGGSAVSYTAWKATYEADAANSVNPFPATARNMAGYNAYLGNTADRADLIARMQAQTKGAYDVRYTVPALLAWVKRGFSPPVQPTNVAIAVDGVLPHVTVSWEDADVLTAGYRVERWDGSAWVQHVVAGDMLTAPAPTSVNTDLLAGTNRLRVVAINSMGESASADFYYWNGSVATTFTISGPSKATKGRPAVYTVSLPSDAGLNSDATISLWVDSVATGATAVLNAANRSAALSYVPGATGTITVEAINDEEALTPPAGLTVSVVAGGTVSPGGRRNVAGLGIMRRL